MNRQSAFSRGFTLVAIMIVVAIIGMLAAVAIPNLMRGRKNAARTACFSNQQTIRANIQMWAAAKLKGDSAAPSEEDLKGYFEGEKLPQCPAGGEYDLKTVAEYPSCSEHGCYKEEEDGKPDDEDPPGGGPPSPGKKKNSGNYLIGTYKKSKSSKLILMGKWKAKLINPNAPIRSDKWKKIDDDRIKALGVEYDILRNGDLKGPGGSIWKKQ